ncbi:hypothetical protein JRQ81_005948 [Phrynocephalus forsythii]|uniref:Uncharacterized protein n=1 Tax=Phrynocephalus forsythii TaxID=171643 RepID=A0A9Q1B607_9SAUR|nr:hypothetical protein JRQ81_005948 [Phrynocephalus forsythii]
MADLEQWLLNHCTQKPLLNFRHIDDIFMIWTYGDYSLIEFYQDFNGFHPNINLTLEQSTQQVNFLDTTVKLQHEHLSTTLYRKAFILNIQQN